jgi:hypothetical protein
MSQQPTSPTGTAPQPGSQQGAPKKNGCMGCLGFVGLFFVVFTIANMAGCEWTKTNDAANSASKPSQDPSLRHIGPRGAVAGYDNRGRTTRLPPGTAVRASSLSDLENRIIFPFH